MRGHDEHTAHMFSYLSPEQRVPADHPLRAVRALTAGHANLSTTQRYMHLSPAAVRGAIELLNQPAPSFATGDIAETGAGAISK